jgi:hypothetical protein
MFMLQSFADSSQQYHREPKVFALGGYIAPADTWARFSAEWQRALDGPPKLDYFKYREALRQDEQFRGWKPEDCIKRAGLFRQVIEQFEPVEFAILFCADHFDRAFQGVPRNIRNPHYFAINLLMPHVARNLEKLGLERGPIDFFFDNQEMEKTRLIQGWEFAAKNLRPAPPDLFSAILKNPLAFRDDKDVLPLQAADMIVTWSRMNFAAELKREDRPPIPGQTKNLHGMTVTYTEDQLREELNRWIVAAQAARRS